MRQVAADSPPESTKSPMDTGVMSNRSKIRASMPSYRPHSKVRAGSRASSSARDWSKRRPAGDSMISVVIRASLVQLDTPDALRGRVSAVNAVFIGTSNQLGEFESGLTAAWFGTVGAVLVGGIGTLAVVALWWWLFPELAHRDSLVAADTPPGT